MNVIQDLVPESKWNIKCPYPMNPEFIVVHNTANDASARNEIAYMNRNNMEVSYHYAIDDIEVVQGLLENRNGWHAGDGNGPGNRKGIGIEICYSKSGGERFDNAERLAAKFIAEKLIEKGWGIEQVKKHQDFQNKYCPHRTLDYGWDRFLDMIRAEMGEQPTPQPTEKNRAMYQVYTNRWLPDVVDYNNYNDNGYAGIYGQAISCLRANAQRGQLIYKVHTKSGKWLGEIINREKEHGYGDDFAGIKGKAIDGLMIRCTEGTARYRVHTKNGKWLPWVNGYNENDFINGYAGIFGQEIDAIQIEIV